MDSESQCIWGISGVSSQQLTTFVYDASGREIEKWLDNETRAVTSYDAASRPLVVSNLESDNSVISQFTRGGPERRYPRGRPASNSPGSHHVYATL